MDGIRHILVSGEWVVEIVALLLITALVTARRRSLSNCLLALVVLCALYRQFVIKMELAGVVDRYPYLIRSSFPTELLAIPLLYFYVLSMTTPNFRFERGHLKHLFSPAFGILWYLAVFFWGDPALFQLGPVLYREYTLRLAIKILIVLPYLLATRRQILTYERRVRDHISDPNKVKLSWLRLVLFIIYIVISVDALGVLFGPIRFVWHVVPIVLFSCLLLLIFFSLRYSTIFTTSEEGEPRPSQLSPEQLEKQKKRLLDLMEGQGLYLNPELRLADLAQGLDLKPYRVSEVLNRGFNTTFYDLVNKYRVKKAEDLLKNPQSSHLNLLGIAMESGFKSKSVFNDVFKKNTGKTPSQVRAATNGPNF